MPQRNRILRKNGTREFAVGDEKKIQKLKRKLVQVENELSHKDNETYRRQNMIFS